MASGFFTTNVKCQMAFTVQEQLMQSGVDAKRRKMDNFVLESFSLGGFAWPWQILESFAKLITNVVWSLAKGGMLIVEPIEFWFLKCGIVPAGWNHCALAWACPCPPPVSSPDSAGKTGEAHCHASHAGLSPSAVTKGKLGGRRITENQVIRTNCAPWREVDWRQTRRQARVTFGV